MRSEKITNLLAHSIPVSPGLPSSSSAQQAPQNTCVQWKCLQTTHVEERSMCEFKLLGSGSISSQKVSKTVSTVQLSAFFFTTGLGTGQKPLSVFG